MWLCMVGLIHDLQNQEKSPSRREDKGWTIRHLKSCSRGISPYNLNMGKIGMGNHLVYWFIWIYWRSVIIGLFILP